MECSEKSTGPLAGCCAKTRQAASNVMTPPRTILRMLRTISAPSSKAPERRSTGVLDESTRPIVGLFARRVGRRFAENLLVNSGIIIPRIHIAGNVRRFDGDSFELVAMRAKEGAQAAVWIEVL